MNIVDMRNKNLVWLWQLNKSIKSIIKSIIKNNIDYEISSEFFLKNMDSYVMNGEIPMLQPKAPNIFNKDYTTMMNLAVSFLGGDNNEQN